MGSCCMSWRGQCVGRRPLRCRVCRRSCCGRRSSFEAIGAAFGGLAAFLGGLIAEGVEAAREFFQEKIEECGGNVVLGILKGIGDALYDIGAWIKEHIFQPFIDGFKNAFGIHSPSTVMEEMGKYIVSGLLLFHR